MVNLEFKFHCRKKMLMKIRNYFPWLSRFSLRSPKNQIRQANIIANDYRGTCRAFGSASRHTTIFSRELPGTIRAGCSSARRAERWSQWWRGETTG